MKNIELFDASLPCPGGIYGENPDPRMIEVANVLNTLEQHGYYVHRYDMAVEPRAYVLNPEVRKILETRLDDGFPVLLVDDEVVVSGHYPSLQEWEAASGLERLSEQLIPLTEAELESLKGDASLSGGCGPEGCSGCAGGCASGW